MAREIATGEIVIGVDTARVESELRYTEAQFNRAMANIGRMKGEAEASVDTTKVDRAIARVKRQIHEIEKANPTVSANLNSKQFDAEYAKLKAKLKDLNQDKVEIGVDTRELKDANRLMKVSATSQQLMARRAMELERAEAKKNKQYRDGAALQQRAIDLDRKRAVDIEKLRIQYIKLHDEIEKGRKLALFDFLGDETARRRFAQTSAELKQVGERLRDLGDGEDDLLRLARASDSSSSRLRGFLTSIGSIRLQMGFFSATLRQTATAFVALGPILFALAGQIAALVGVIGTSLAGALAVTSAGLVGFGLTALGVGLIMKPLVGDLMDAKKASDAYGDAVRKYGKGSDQAKTAQEKLNKTLGDVGPATRAAFESLGTLSDRWSTLTAGARPMFFTTVASGIKAANKLLPMFASESVKAFNVAGKETQKFFNLMSSPKAAAGIKEIMSNFTASFPDLSAGFRTIVTMLGKISASASKLLPSLTSGFKDWTDGLNESLGSGAGLDQRIARLVDHMRDMGKFLQSAGSMLTAFFSAGANEGATLLQTLTSIMDRWTAWMQSTAGQQGLAEFFKQANYIGSAFIGTLAQIGIALFEFSQAFAPLSMGILIVVRGLSQMVAAIMSLSAARAVVTGLGAALASAFVVGKIAAVVAVLRGIPIAIAAIRAAMMGGGLAALFATPAGPWIALGAAIVGVVVAIDQLSGPTKELASSLAATASDADRAKAALDRLAGIELTATEASARLTSSKLDLADATAAYRKHEADGTVATAAGQRALLAMMNAQNAVKRARQELNKAVRDAQKVEQENTKGTLARVTALMDEQENLRTSIASGKEYLSTLSKGSDQYREQVETIRYWQQALKNVNRELAETKDRNLAVGERAAMIEKLNAGLRTGMPVAAQYADEWLNISENINKAAQKKVANLFQGNAKQAGAAINEFSKAIDNGLTKKANQIVLNPKLNDQEVLAALRRINKVANEKKTALVEAKVQKGTAERDLGNLGKGKTATINAKANTKNAEQALKGLTGKQLAARLTIRADNRDAMTKLNQVERKQLRAKMLRLGADPKAVDAAIARINNVKIPAKIAQFKAQAQEAEAADKRVQGFRDKNVRVKTIADLSGTSAAQNAINSIPNTTYKDVVTRYRSEGSPGRAAGGPVNFAGGGNYRGGSAKDDKNQRSIERANMRQNRPGLYKRPTLLVGEENRDEYVIATNPAYRASNERYLGAAAREFGYELAPIEGAAAGKASSAAGKYGRSRTGYDFIRSQISQLQGKSSALDTERRADISRDGSSKISLESVIAPLQEALSPWYTKLQNNLARRANKSARVADTNARKLKAGVYNKQIAAAKKKHIAAKKALKNAPEGDRRAREKAVDAAQAAIEKARENKKNARDAVQTRGDSAGELWRELQGLGNEKHDLRNTIQSLRDNEADVGGGAGGTSFGVQLGALDKARYDVFNQFAGNIMAGQGGAGLSALSGSSATPFSSASPSFYAPGGGSIPGAVPTGAAAGGPAVVQNITIAEPPPDPHSFSRQLGWEAAAMLG